METIDLIISRIGDPEGYTLEYKAVLPPPKVLSATIAAFANSNGGVIILGVADQNGLRVVGISREFRITDVLNKALEYLSPKPHVKGEYATIQEQNVFIIQIEKADHIVYTADGKQYKREGSLSKLILNNSTNEEEYNQDLVRIREQLNIDVDKLTNSRQEFLNFIERIIDIIDNLYLKYFPKGMDIPTENIEGKVLYKILFSSCADNFEIYMSNILYEIYLSNPNTLKSNEIITIKEVLDCGDMQEFVEFWAHKKISKLQKGSVKGFINDNKQIKELNVLDRNMIRDLEKILQIRHLYTHSQGIIDDKFLRYFSSGYNLNDEFELSLTGMFEYINILTITVKLIDEASITEYNLEGI